MSSLEAVNKTLGRIEEDTDLLNRNFHKWFLTQERSKLDAEEDRRERKKLLAMLGTAAAAGAGRGGRGGGAGRKASGGMNPLAFLNNLPPWAKLLLGVYAGKAVYGAYKVVTAPVRYGNKIGQAAVNYYDERMRKNFEAQEAIRLAKRKAAQKAEADRLAAARREFQKAERANLLAQIAAQKAETARLLAQINAGSVTPDAPKPQELDTLSRMPTTSPDAPPLTSSRTPPSSLSTPTKIDGSPTKPLLPKAPFVQTDVSDLKHMRIIITGDRVSYWEKGRGYIPVEEAVSRLRLGGLDANGNPIPIRPSAIDDFTVDTKPAPKPAPRQRRRNNLVRRGNKSVYKGARMVAGAVPLPGLLDLLLNAYIAGEDVSARARDEGRLAKDAEFDAMLAAGFDPRVVVRDIADLLSLGSNFAFGTEFDTQKGITKQRAIAKTLSDFMDKHDIRQDTKKYLGYVARVKGSGFDPLAYQLYDEVKRTEWNNMTELERAKSMANDESNLGTGMMVGIRQQEKAEEAIQEMVRANEKKRAEKGAVEQAAAEALMLAAGELGAAAQAWKSAAISGPGSKGSGGSMPWIRFSSTSDTNQEKLETAIGSFRNSIGSFR